MVSIKENKCRNWHEVQLLLESYINYTEETKIYLQRKRVKKQTHSIQHFSYYKNIAHSDNVAQITGFL